jgi:hypothetical protein
MPAEMAWRFFAIQDHCYLDAARQVYSVARGERRTARAEP